METAQILQLITASCFTIVGLIFLRRRDERNRNQARLAGILFLVAAALNWILFARVFG